MGSSRIENLRAILRASSSAAEPEVAVALKRVYAELDRRLIDAADDSNGPFTDALQALTQMKGTGNASLRLLCLHRCALYFFQHGNAMAAYNAANQHELLSTRIGDKQGVRKAKTMKGLVHADVGAIGDALAQFSIAFEIATTTGDMEGKTSTLINLGVALNYAGLYHEAITCFQRGAELANRMQDARFQGGALSNLSQSYLFLGEFELARSAIVKCLSIAPDPSQGLARVHRTIREFTYVQIALELGLLDLAKERAGLCREYGYAANMIRTKVMADVANALCDVRAGNSKAGLLLLENSRLQCNNLASLFTDVLVASVKAYDEAELPENALKCLNELMDHLSKQRAQAVDTLFRVSEEFKLIPDPGRSFEHDLRALELKKANLRAKVAERGVADIQFEMFERLAITAGLKHDSSGEHGYRVARLSALLAEEMGWDKVACSGLDLAARLHDIGKIGMPDDILLNSLKLKDTERHTINKHTTLGAELLAKSDVPQLKLAREIAAFHHERWDGHGYPSRLSGKRIPIHARIVALADVFDAITHGRPFAPAWPMSRALEEIQAGRGTQFDPELTDRFLTLVQRLAAEHPNLDYYLAAAGRNSQFQQARNRINELLAAEAPHAIAETAN
jgi:putative nucleotidyltransferase with HDIG domain